MKLIGTLSIASIAAQNATMTDLARRLRDRQNLIDHIVPPKIPGGRSVMDVKFYGCWCLPGANADVPNKGTPVDNLDAACKRANQCYYCAKMDNSDRDKSCEARGVGYDYQLVTGDDPNDFSQRSIICTDDPNADEVKASKEKNSGERKVSKYACRRQVCECDKRLAEELLAVWGEYNSEFKHKNNDGEGFDVDNSCKNDSIDDALPRGDLECCGPDYGVRMPFYSSFGMKMCCNDRTYNVLYQSCCDGNVVPGNTC